jgi:hypothetical protein
MSKKGDYWSLALLLMTVFVLGWMSFLALTQSNFTGKVVGVDSVLLFDFFDEVETKLIFYDKALEYGFSDSLKLLLRNGGSFDLASEEEDYLLWKRDVQECYPTEEKIKENLGLYLDNAIGEDFEFTFEKGEKLIVIGTSVEEIEFSEQVSNLDIKYSFKPKLKLKVDYNLDQIMIKVFEVKGIIESCGDSESCWEKANFDWEKSGTVYTFDVDMGKIEDVFGETDLVLKGAVDFGSSIGKPALVC